MTETKLLDNVLCSGLTERIMEQMSQSREPTSKELVPADEELELNPNRPLLEEIGRRARQFKEEQFKIQVRNMAENVDRARREREQNNEA